MIVKRNTAEGVRFIVYNNSGGKRRYVGTFESKKAAEHGEQDFAVTRRRIDRGELPEEVDIRRTFADAADEWLKALTDRKSRSLTIYEKRLQIYVRPTFDKVRISDITKAKVLELRDRIASRLSPSSVNGIIVCLSSAFTYFVEDRQWLDRNPCHGIGPIENPEKTYAWIHTKAEINRLLLNCNDDLRDMVALTLATGLRIDELCHLRWDDVDLETRIISVHRGKHGTVKTGKLRRVPILDSVLAALKARALKRGGALLVFPGKGGEVRTKPGIREVYRLALDRAKLDLTLRWHDLRHTFASHWMMDGGDIFKLSRILGHSNVKMTLRYAHLAPSAFEVDYGRLAFKVPTETAKLVVLVRGDGGRVIGTRRAVQDALG